MKPPLAPLYLPNKLVQTKIVGERGKIHRIEWGPNMGWSNFQWYYLVDVGKKKKLNTHWFLESEIDHELVEIWDGCYAPRR